MSKEYPKNDVNQKIIFGVFCISYENPEVHFNQKKVLLTF